LIGLLFTLSLLGIAQYSSAQNTHKAQDSFTLATKLLNESNIKEAKKNIEDALALKPNNSDYKNFITRIENAEKSLEGITNAEQLIENGMLQEALEILNTANSPDLGIDVKSSFLIQKITPTILAENQIQVQKYLSSKQFSDAKEKLNVLISLYAGKKDILDELMRAQLFPTESQYRASIPKIDIFTKGKL
jgi:tetratricopeptide (TPR) repeat protein